MEKLTKEQIFKYQKELEYFYDQRKKLLTIALVLLGVSVVGLIGMIVMFTIANSSSIFGALAFTYLFIFSIAGAIVLFILRSALYNARINNRKIALEYTELQEKENKKEE